MKKNIVVLGGGFGGLRTALSIAYDLKHAGLLDRYCVTLVDRREYHTYTPILHQVAVPPVHPSKMIDEDRVVRKFKDILKGKEIDFVHGEAVELDLERGDIHLARGEELSCDYLALAPGSETNYFGIPGLEENSLPLKTFADAKRIQIALSETLLGNPAARILVGGGGPTGVELAGEIKFSYPKARVAIVEAMPKILPGFGRRFRRAAARRLRKLGVGVDVNEPISSVGKGLAISKNKRELPFDIFIWTGGVKAPEFLSALPIKTEPRGRAEVMPGMLCLPQAPDLKLGPMVYALGDSVCVYDPETGKPLPGVAPTAIEQGEVVAGNIFRDILKSEGSPYIPKRRRYRIREHPYALSVGGRWAVAKMGPVVLTGILAWAFKRAIEIDYSLSLR